MGNQYSIRRQLALLTFIPILLISVSLEVFFLHDRFTALNQDLLERGKLIARQLSLSSEYGVFSNNRLSLEDVARGTLLQPDVRGVIVFDVAAEILVQAGNFAEPSKNTETVSLLTPIQSDENSLWIYQPIIPSQIKIDDFDDRKISQQIGGVIVELDKKRTEKLKSSLLFISIFVPLFFLLCVLYIVYLGSRKITRPIQKLSETINALGTGNLTARASVSSSVTELTTLIHGVNEMANELQHERDILQSRIEEATFALREKKNEAESASHEKSRFLAVASHDLRQPLHALGLYISELQRKVSDSELEPLVGQIEHSVEAFSGLLNALLDISKLDAGAVFPKIQTCDMTALLNRVAADYLMLARMKNIRFSVRCSYQYVSSDPLLLERILTNLVSNAIRYTPQNGSVFIACKKRGNQLRIEVRDNGVGIAKHDTDNIFREFFQLAPTQLELQKGLGLGLSIVDRLVKLLGHKLTVQSAPQQGSIFALELPLAVMPKVAPLMPSAKEVDEKESNSPLLGKTMLIVDDDLLVLQGTALIVESWGCNVMTAISLAEVQRFLARGHRWDMVVSDYQIGDTDTGFDVVKAVRKASNEPTPCILISGNTSPDLQQLASDAELQLLLKPVKPAKLRSLILFLLGVR